MGAPYTTVVAATRYQTEDGRWWDTEAAALAWHRNLRERVEMNAMLDAGATLGAIAERFPGWCEHGVSGGIYTLPDVLRDVTATHRFVISHWQCNDSPVYEIGRFNADGTVYVGGSGSWMGHYGNDLSFADIARYPAHARAVSP